MWCLGFFLTRGVDSPSAVEKDVKAEQSAVEVVENGDWSNEADEWNPVIEVRAMVRVAVRHVDLNKAASDPERNVTQRDDQQHDSKLRPTSAPFIPFNQRRRLRIAEVLGIEDEHRLDCHVQDGGRLTEDVSRLHGERDPVTVTSFGVEDDGKKTLYDRSPAREQDQVFDA